MGRPQLTVRMLGTFAVYRDDELITEDEWRTERNKALLKVLLTRPGEVFPAEELMAGLWPETDPASSRRNLQGRISELRRILEPGLNRGSKSAFIQTTRTGYRFITDHSTIDTQQFETEYQCGLDAEAQGRIEAAIEHYRQAASYYKGRPLPADGHEEWAAPFQQALELDYRELLARLVDNLTSQGRYGEAVRYCRTLVERDPYEEAHYRRLMTCHFEQGDPTQALIAYERLRDALRLAFQTAPSETTQALADSIRDASDPSSVREKLWRRVRELERSHDPDDRLELIDILDQLGEHAQVNDTIHRARADLRDETYQAWLSVKESRTYQSMGAFQQAREAAQRAHQQFHELGHQAGEAGALAQLSHCHFRLSQLAQAEACARQSEECCRALGDKDGQANVLIDRANVAVSRGAFDEAQGFLDTAYRLASEGGHQATQVRTAYTFGFWAFRQDWHGQAKLFFERAYEQASRIADHYLALISLESLGVIAGLEGRIDENIAIHQHVAERRRQAGDADRYIALNSLGNAYCEVGYYREAIACFEALLELVPQDDPLRVGMGLCNLGSVYIEQGQYDQAADCLQEASDRIAQTDDQWWQVRLKLEYGRLCQATGDLPAAIGCYEQAREAAHTHGNSHLEWEALSRLLDAHADQGSAAPMRPYLERAEALTEALSDEQSAFHCWTLFRACRVLGQSTKAERYLRWAYEDLMERADRLNDAGMRRSFLANVPLHLGIRSTFEEYRDSWSDDA